MLKSIPKTGIIGLAVSAMCVGLWGAEQLSGQLGFELITIPFKLWLLVMPLFFLSDLSSFLQGKHRVALGLAITLILATICAGLLYLPWRDSFARHFNNDVYRWYYLGMPNTERHPGFKEWERDWSLHIPHLIEAALATVYFGGLVATCAFMRLDRVGSFITGMLGYALLLVIPMTTGLILWDYDTFLRGIIFDSISMDLYPMVWWYAGDYSIFLYVFLFLFFGISGAFFCRYGKSDETNTL
jgi:hypothetical protein